MAPPAHPIRLMGVLNVTPDSFSDGGEWFDGDAALAHAADLIADGADILDVGGESTRPGAAPVPEHEELRRVIPIVDAVAARHPETQVSVDTSKLAVARAALDAGATYVNDVTAFRADPGMAALTAERGADCCLMHMLGEPRTMQDDPHYEDVVDDVKAFLHERLERAVAAGISEQRIVLDPGIGFGKSEQHNLELLRRLDEFGSLGVPVVAGWSRKSTLGVITGKPVGERLAASIAAALLSVQHGANILRVHDVTETRDALAVWQALRNA